MESVSLFVASRLLGISRQRIQQLIYANRVKGAFKTEKGWKIPLYQQIPQIIPANRGMKGTWRTKAPKKKIIHVNRRNISMNNRKKQKEPVIAVRIGSKKVHYCHQVSFDGQCTVVYEPESGNKHGGAKVWIDVSATTKVMITDWRKPKEEQIMILG